MSITIDWLAWDWILQYALSLLVYYSLIWYCNCNSPNNLLLDIPFATNDLKMHIMNVRETDMGIRWDRQCVERKVEWIQRWGALYQSGRISKSCYLCPSIVSHIEENEALLYRNNGVEKGQMNMVEGESLYQNVILKLMNMFRELFENHCVCHNAMSHITESVSYVLWKECHNVW